MAIATKRINIVINHVAKNVRGFKKVMSKNQRQFRDVTNASDGLNRRFKNMNNSGAKLAHRTRMMTHGLRGFKMELLSVMFFGMALQRTFGGLLKTSMEWMGVTKIFSTALGILFLPVAELLLDWAMVFLDWVSGLSESTKETIGIFVLLAVILGTLLFVFGTVGLGIGGLIMAFGSLMSPLGVVLGLLTAFGTSIAIKKLPDLLGNMSDKAKEADKKLQGFGITGNPLQPLVSKMEEHLPRVMSFFDDMKEKIKKKFKDLAVEISGDKGTWSTVGKNLAINIFNGIKNYIKDNPLLVVGAIIGTWLGGPVGGMIGATLAGIFEDIDMEKMNEIVDKGFEILDGIMSGLMNNADKIGTALEDLIRRIGIWIGDNIDEIFSLGFKLFKYIWRGFVEGALNIGFGAGKAILEAIGVKDVSMPTIGSKQTGGFISETGPYLLHKGETVVPANQRIGPTTITVNATVSSDYDVRRLADQLKRYWVEDFESLTQSRGLT